MASDRPDATAGEVTTGPSADRHRAHGHRARRWGLIAGGALAGLIAMVALALVCLNTGPGRAFAVDRLAAYRTESGLNIRIGRIEGSLFGRMTLHDVALSDPQGVFAVVPIAEVAWRPLALLRKKIDLRELSVPTARLLRRPALRKTPRDPDKPLLPDIDVAAPLVRIDRIVFEPAVTGRRHAASLKGSAGLADGRAQLDLTARALDAPGLAGGDRLRAVIDVFPEANRLRVDVDLNAPRGGLVDSYLRLDAPLVVTLDGRGDWKSWNGRASARLGTTPLLDLFLSARDGRFGVVGEAWPARLAKGPAARLLEPKVAVDATGALVRRRLDGRLTLTSDALSMTADGAVDLGANRFDQVRVNARLLRPGALAENLTGRDVRLDVRLHGRLARLQVDYELSAAAIGMAETRIEDLQAAGRARLAPNRIRIPIKATAARVSGLNGAAGGLLTRLTLTGDLAYSDGRLLSDNLRLRSAQIDATAVIVADLKAGQYTGALKGRVNDYAVDSVGRFNLVTDARLTTASGGGFGLRGSVRVSTRHLDNETLRDLLGGQGVLTASVELQPGGVITVADLRLQAPDFQIVSGGGSYRPDGRLEFRAAARSSRYGPLALTASGTAQRPVLRLTAEAPNVGIPLTDVVLDIAGADEGYRIRVRGGSPYGPFSGLAFHRAGPDSKIEIAALTAAGVTLSGTVSQAAAGPFVGTLQADGSGLAGVVRLGATGDVQRADLDLRADHAALQLDPVVTIANGRLTATVLLPPEGPQISGEMTVANLVRGGLTLSTARARGRYDDGRGSVGVVAQGRNGAPFNLAAQASLTPRLIRANLQGSLNRISLRLAAPAELHKTAKGWRLAPVRVVLPRGEIVLSGQTGEPTELTARLRNVDLSLVQGISPTLAFEGSATGLIEARLPGKGVMPAITARMDVSGFSRVGLASESPPVDLAVHGGLSGAGGQVQALVRRGGATIGRLQARTGPMPATAAWSERVAAAPLSGGIRYNGPANVLWAMTGISGQEVSGPLALAADFGGRVREPTLTGVIRADALRYENPTYATVISDIAVRGHFTQSRLEITSLSGRAGSGAISAKGWVGLDAAAGFPMDLRATLDRAQLADSDALGASVSGTLAVTNSRARGALIQGELRIPEARYQIVRQGSADVPVLEGVRRRGTAAPIRDAAAPTAPPGGLPSDWKLNIRIRSDNRIYVTGMGLESEWGADLRVRGTAGNPVVTGQLDLVRGTYSFAGRRMELSKAEVRFDGRQATNPLIDIAASTTVEGVTATVNVTGRAQYPQIAFTSIPALPQDEVLSRLLFGSSVGQLSPTQAIQIAAALNGLRNGGGDLNPLGKLRSVAGVDRLRILGADEASGRGTALAAGAYLGRNVYVEIVTDARGFTATQLEIALSRTLSLLMQTASFGGSSVELKYSKDY